MKAFAILYAMFLTFCINTAYAITEVINTDQVEKMNLQSMGVIAETVRADTLDEAVKAIETKAEKQGALYYRIIGARSYDTSPYWRISAQLYKK
ncbi:YdgH/BhsA/McbA family protein [Pragia fontium]|uniref:YdgH/BhsA/McbA-like domain-containing protein n=1 Tax=Pragia fontium DSM 5563 = ATCC 49100 TaxID=1122977 RepID=A0AAJ5BHR5_9GAMM|nr:DUF1471 domain-containing protein [Pragia fontium]SFD06579.1 Protein of unknown function [Pragia fontium DSM 5563 = ATCC 49100]VEJ56266.1 putative biofilm stress and motility protein A [Pragia fontium]